LQLAFPGVWFQVQNGEAFHDIHTHGNSSWSGVYYVQIDSLEQRERAPLGKLNGATRFYSPMFPFLGGAYMVRGSSWLQKSTLDHVPREGDLLVFPSMLAHKAMPYSGERDRIVLSFNAQITSSGNVQLFRFASV
jgi:uncharacterized protein (TIGR02466 family)